ncbi:MAG TPA: hypothetical protein VJ023_10950, partial [Pyrinomonadaceae bacterium]|nr:hypothetical protein [Pyrinomonadaceae bacterium]
MFVAIEYATKQNNIPPACPVVPDVRGYRRSSQAPTPYHRLARWSLMFVATDEARSSRGDTTGLPGGGSCSWLQNAHGFRRIATTRQIGSHSGQRETPRGQPVASG